MPHPFRASVPALLLAFAAAARGQAPPGADFPRAAKPLVAKYCLGCHSAKAKKGSLDLERFATAADLRAGLKVWEGVVEQVETGEMPPKDRPQPTVAERKQLLGWVRDFLAAESRARAGDPGFVPLRRLSHAEYDNTVRDLTGVDLRPAREFPTDAAAGEGFTNAAEALTDVSPPLLTKYLNAAKDIADHAVLLPDGFRFSPSKTRRDWTDEGTAALRAFYAAHAPAGGKLPVQSYLSATVRHRGALAAGRVAEVAAEEKLNPKYLAALWAALTDATPSDPLDAVRAKWRAAGETDVPTLAAEVAAWQAAVWRTVKVGNYVQASWHTPGGYVESVSRQVPADPPAADSVPLRVAVKPAPGQSEVTVTLAARGAGGVVWSRPRFEGAGRPPLLLRDYAQFGPAFEADYPSAFADAAKYLGAAADLARDPKAAPPPGLDAPFLARWVEVLAVSSSPAVSAVPLTLLDEPAPKTDQRPAISGWRKKGTDLPSVVANASDRTEQIPGRVSARGVAVHPTPAEFVAVVWKSPAAGPAAVAVRVAHAHPACGNGVAWRAEHRRGGRAAVLGEGSLDLGKEAKPPAFAVKLEAGDTVVLVVDARDGNHVCDLTEVGVTVTAEGSPARTWDLAADVSGTVLAANPHADRHGNADTWAFARGPSKGGPASPIPAGSVLARWRAAAADPGRKDEAAKLAAEAQALLSGPRPAKAAEGDRALYDRLVTADGPLFVGVDVAKVAKPRKPAGFGLPAERFTGADILVPADTPVVVRLPAALFAGREFVVDAKLDGPAAGRVVRVRAGTDPAGPWAGSVLADSSSAAYRRLLDGQAAFCRAFPLFVCFPEVVPTDEVVTLKMFHREDEPLARLFLTDDEARRLDRLWVNQRFVSRQPVAEFDYLPQFMGYTTQDTPKAFQQFFIDRKPRFRADAEAFLAEEVAAAPRHLDALLAFAARAYRRPLADAEKAELLALYKTVRGKGVPHDGAFRAVLARVLVAPAFLFRIEPPPPGREPCPVTDWELATRLSYFLWASAPDDELRSLAAAGKLRDPAVLADQTRRMLKDGRARGLAVEFGAQWLHVRGFDTFAEKNETLFPTFDAKLRADLYEEAVRFLLDLFQSDRPVTAVLDADHAFLNDRLAKHYGIPGVAGPHFRRVAGVRKFGRGGVLGLGSVQAKQAGASRTSPVLRGNWVVETLLGEKLPRPPANVPQLPEAEGADKLSVRQLVERHAKDPACATCHVRIDPFGFALERYDPIGRFREKDLAGRPVDTRAKLRDGTEFDGIDGLRNYLLTAKKDVVVRLFCRRLLGYALGRAVTLSDTTLLDEMVRELDANGGRVTAAVLAIVNSPQFRMSRGRDHAE